MLQICLLASSIIFCCANANVWIHRSVAFSKLFDVKKRKSGTGKKKVLLIVALLIRRCHLDQSSEIFRFCNSIQVIFTTLFPGPFFLPPPTFNFFFLSFFLTSFYSIQFIVLSMLYNKNLILLLKKNRKFFSCMTVCENMERKQFCVCFFFFQCLKICKDYVLCWLW